MALDETLNRISNVEFFAAMPAGAYMFGSIYCATVIDGTVERSVMLWTALLPLVEQLSTKPLSVLMVLFAAYVIGAVFRTLPVKLIDWKSSMVVPKPERFPYRSYLARVRDELAEYKGLLGASDEDFPEIGSAVPRSVFNYWKDWLCLRAPGAFSYYQTWEARTRFFAGMCWAGFVGILCSAVVVARAGFVPATWQLGLLSTVLSALFYSRIPRAREQEVAVLLTFIIAMRRSDAIKD